MVGVGDVRGEIIHAQRAQGHRSACRYERPARLTDGEKPTFVFVERKDHRFNEATRALLTAVTGIPEDLLRRVRVRHRRYNWLHAPWYPASEGGGGLTVGDRIHVTPTHDPATLGNDPERWLRWVLLMAHEVGHVRQAQRFGSGTWGRSRFVLWATKNYVVSFFRNGRAAHAKAPFEVDADSGRKELRRWLEFSGGCRADHPVVAWLIANDVPAMERWVASSHASLASRKPAD